MKGVKVLLWVLVGLHLFKSAAATEIKIGLFYGKNVQTVVFSVVEGEYLISGDGTHVLVARTGSIFQIRSSVKGCTVNDTSGTYGTFTQLEFKGVSTHNIFQIRPVFPALSPIESDDDLLISNTDYGLKIINRIDLEKYIPGTLEAEGGSNAPAEFYKAQAVLSRTYAVNNYDRHAGEGFNLCDGEHCQAFKGKSHMNREIYAATISTAGEILVDADNKPVITPYHSNCGGFTSSASMAWSNDLPYLVAVKDPFCIDKSNNHWSKTLSMADWKNYLKGKGINDLSNVIPIPVNQGRQKFIILGSSKLATADIRRDLNLKSSFFTIAKRDSDIVINGFGYGHGVGLCQQGAIEMARVGYVYVDILMFYFRGLHLMKITTIQ